MIFLLIINMLFSGQDTLPEKNLSRLGFKNAVSVTTDGKGFIYVLDNEAGEIIKLDDKLNEVKRTGKKGWNNGEFDSPTFIDGSSGLDIYVTDGNNYRIQRFDLNLSYVSSLVTNSPTFDEKLKFNTPVASLVLNTNAMYVIDGENKRIVCYPDGMTPKFSFGGFQSAQKPLVNPVKLFRDGFNNLFVLDKKNNSLQQYDNFGNFIKSLESSIIKSVSIYNNIIYIFTGGEIIFYSVNKNAYTGKVSLPEEYRDARVNDMLVYSENKILFLYKDKIEFYTLN